MIFGNETISTYSRANVTIWMILAFQAGWLNMGGFMACHSFVSHVTGYFTLFGLEAWRSSDFKFMSGMVLVPAFFLAGAALSGLLVDVRVQLRLSPRYWVVFGVLFAWLLFVVVGGFNGFFGRFGEPLESSRDYTLLACLCLICGLQNGTVSLVSRSVVRTTHLTGITTDLGIGLVRSLFGVGGEGRANLMRVGVISFFVVGGVLAAGVFSTWGFRGFLVPCAISGGLFFVCAWYQLVRSRSARPR